MVARKSIGPTGNKYSAGSGRREGRDHCNLEEQNTHDSHATCILRCACTEERNAIELHIGIRPDRNQKGQGYCGMQNVILRVVCSYCMLLTSIRSTSRAGHEVRPEPTGNLRASRPGPVPTLTL